MTTIRTPNDVLAKGTTRSTLDIAQWTLQVLMALVFVLAGSGKIFVSPEKAALFDGLFGVGPWFRYLTASLEFLGGLLLVVPGKTAYGAVLLACVMVGAVVVHLAVLHDAATVPLALFGLLGLIIWGRRSQLGGLHGS